MFTKCKQTPRRKTNLKPNDIAAARRSILPTHARTLPLHVIAAGKEDICSKSVTVRKKKKQVCGNKAETHALTRNAGGGLHSVGSAARPPILVDVSVEGVPLCMELNTGASVSVVSRQQYKQLFASSSMQPTELRLRTYTGEVVKPCGVIHVHVAHNNQQRL